jgi:hypothetical protein
MSAEPLPPPLRERVGAGGVALAVTMALAITALAQTKRPDPSIAKLPPGAGRDAVIEFCAGACHPVDRIVNARKTPAEWKKTVLQMVSNGAQLFPEDIDTVTNYLVVNFAAK